MHYVYSILMLYCIIQSLTEIQLYFIKLLKYISSADKSYAAICEVDSHVYIFWQSEQTELRNR